LSTKAAVEFGSASLEAMEGRSPSSKVNCGVGGGGSDREENGG
jgi:hypothetical protein